MNTKILKDTDKHRQEAADTLLKGDLVAIPTETVYGLAADAFQEAAVLKIFQAKDRPQFDPLIVHVSPQLLGGASSFLEGLESLNLVQGDAFDKNLRQRIDALFQKFWPGPLTVVLPKNPKVPDLVTSGLPNVAVRMPLHPAAQDIISRVGSPLAAPSANRFGKISPTTAKSVHEELDGRIPLILDGGPCSVGLESTVVKINPEGSGQLLRPGKVGKREIEQVLKITLKTVSPTDELTPQASPGLMKSHYAPRQPLHFLPTSALELSNRDKKWLEDRIPSTTRRIALLSLFGEPKRSAEALQEKTGIPVLARCLSPAAETAEAARNLFSILRDLSHSDADLILVEPMGGNDGLAYAIKNRLERAASP